MKQLVSPNASPLQRLCLAIIDYIYHHLFDTPQIEKIEFVEYLRKTLDTGRIDVSSFVTAAILLRRYRNAILCSLSDVEDWKGLLATAILLGNKLTEDSTLSNRVFGVPIDWEFEFAKMLDFNFWVSANEYQAFCTLALRIPYDAPSGPLGVPNYVMREDYRSFDKTPYELDALGHDRECTHMRLLLNHAYQEEMKCAQV
eukprot:Platyproteum_vivax@DN13224_c0_g1_i1.p1